MIRTGTPVFIDADQALRSASDSLSEQKWRGIKAVAERFLSEGFFVTRAMRYLKN